MATTQTTPELTAQCEDILRGYYKQDILELAGRFPKDQQSLTLDWMDIYRSKPDLADDLLDHPERIISEFEGALGDFDIPVDVDLSSATVRISNLHASDTHNVTDTRADHINNYLAVNGQVQKTSPVHPRYETIAYECQRCGTLKYIPQTSQSRQEPHECEGCERQGPWTINEDGSEFVDHQLVRIQEPPERTKGLEGEHIDAHLEADLVDTVRPGDRVDMHGIFRVKDPGDGVVAEPFLDAHAAQVQQTDFEDIAVDEHLEDINKLAEGEEGDPYRLLVDSIAPKIRGMRDIKEAIALQMFGGWRHENPDGTVDRGDSHIFLVGDPGSGKSTILRAVEDLAPRAVFTEGKGLTKAGATAAATRDDFGNTEWGLEAGVMVLANKGIACIDELDKVDDGAKESLHGALESQRVNINKAGINATLPAQTALLAAGNPVHGRFDQHEAISAQIDLSPTLVSRFDLIFTVTDQPDEKEDRKIAEHIIDSRQAVGKMQQDRDVGNEQRALIEPAIDRELLRAYIAYAKQNVFPTIEDKKVKSNLVDFYTNLRTAGKDDGTSAVPVTARSLDAIQRLAEASARIRLSQEIEQEDIERATKLVQKTMREVGIDPETGEFDVDVIQTGRSRTQHDRIRDLQLLIRDLYEEEGSLVPRDMILDAAEDEGYDRGKVDHDITQLLDSGDLFNPDGKGEKIGPT